MINRATLLGRIGKKEEKTLKSGNNLTALSIATTKKWKNHLGEPQEETTWHNVQCFGKIAEIANKYTTIGQFVYIEGEINHRKHETGNGDVKYYYSITCSELKLIPGQKKAEEKNSANSFQNGNTSDFDDLIPF